jgi:2,5-furandicarboxylate decarboxylase 1
MRKTVESYLDRLQEKLPRDLILIKKSVNPARFDVTAILQHLENRGMYPALLFDNALNLKGERSAFRLLTNVFATRQRCALALDLDPLQWKLDLSLEYAKRENRQIEPEVVSTETAPVKEVVKKGPHADLRDFPILRHHEMDGGPYIDMVVVMRDPDEGFYNASFHRNEYRTPQKMGIHMSPRHNWTIFRKNEERNRPTPVAVIVSHHPAFYLGALNVAGFGTNDYALIGSIMREPLRLTASETWGEQFLVPADAEIIIEGTIPPKVREIEGPFGEFPGTYGPQRWRPVIEVKAVTHKRKAIYQDIFVGHRDTWIVGGIPKEGSLFNAIKGVVPTVKAVHFAVSGACRFNCYISVDKKVEGETKQAALMAMAQCDFVKNVVVVDVDVDPFNEQEVMWAVATRVQPAEDVDIIRNIKGNTLDPSLTHDIRGSKMIIDATKPVDRPFARKVNVPDEALDRIRLEDFIGRKVLGRLTGPDEEACG